MKKFILAAAVVMVFSLIYAKEPSRFTVTSRAFISGEMIPKDYTCEGINISPDMAWIGAPKGTVSFIVICDDPDIPVKTPGAQEWVHWVVYNIPAKQTYIRKSQPKLNILPGGSRQGITSFKTNAYGGPCPPFGTHRYYFRVYALDSMLTIAPEKATKKAVLELAQAHIIGYGELMGKYAKGNKEK